MVTKDQIQSEGLTTDDVMNRMFEEPMREPEWLPEWDDHPEERPGENLELDDGVLSWTYEGHHVELESIEVTHWRATIDIPDEYGKYYPRPVDLKCSPIPEYGFVEGVEMDGYTPESVTLVINENFMPTLEVNKFIDKIVEDHKGSEEFEAEVSELLDAARENE